MAKNWENAAGIIWKILVEAALKKKTVSYSQLAPAIKTNPLSVRFPLGLIQDYCIENNLPPLTSIVVGKNSKKPGEGFIAWDVDDLQSGQTKVFDTNWKAIPNPYVDFGAEDTVVSFAKKILEQPDASEEIYSKVKVRGIAQKIFRQILLEAYDNKCAFCGFSFTDALEAAHILPWSACGKNERLNPKNGILLCAIHHQLFDAGLITVSESYKITFYDDKQNDGEYSKCDEFMTTKLHGNKIRLPVDDYKPNIAYIRERNKRDEWGKLS